MGRIKVGDKKGKKGVRVGVQYCGVALLAFSAFFIGYDIWKSFPNCDANQEKVTDKCMNYESNPLSVWCSIMPFLSGYFAYIVGKEKCTQSLAQFTVWWSFFSMISTGLYLEFLKESLQTDANADLRQLEVFLFFGGVVCEVLMCFITVLCCLSTKVCVCQTDVEANESDNEAESN